MDTAEQDHATASPECHDEGIQRGGYLLELSTDWIVLRSSQNIDQLLGQSHDLLIGEPLGRFVHAQALHDLRNQFSRLSATTGIGRAYAIRLTDGNGCVDIAFQLGDGRVLLEAVPSSDGFGECFGSVGGLIAGLAGASGQALMEAGARRMRALTGFDRVTLSLGDYRAESSRGKFAAPAQLSDRIPAIVADVEAPPIPLFPRDPLDSPASQALIRAPQAEALEQLRREGVRACLCVPFSSDGGGGEFRCDSRTARAPHFEMHAAAELFAQLFAMRLEIDRLRTR